MSSVETVTTEETRNAAAVREEVSAWLAANWDPDLTVGEWWERLAESGWAVPAWPEEWFGRGLSRDLAAVVTDEIRKAGAIGPPAGLGLLLAGPTIIAHGTDEQKKRWIRPIVTGQAAWCQLFSEPGAGSDLAGLQTRAVRDGDEWVVTGQKVWTSGGHFADMGMLIARTNPDVPKHAGISYFGIEMDQPGIVVRPLREMTGHALFNEVFLDGARVPDDAIVGGEGNGWKVANTTLLFERQGLGSGGSGAATTVPPGRKAGHLERRVGDYRSSGSQGATAVFGLMNRSAPMLLQLAKDRGASTDPTIRQQLAELYTLAEIGRFTVLRTKAAAKAGRPPGPEANTAKLMMSRSVRLARDVGLRILGPYGMLTRDDAPLRGAVAELALFSPAVSIYGGTDEIQRNIIGERVLGLPAEPRTDKDVPFRDLKVGTQAG
jgi:alkylation response protein AidB-like acyl-CoA dehydrogenase